jgi:hypothetical protein
MHNEVLHNLYSSPNIIRMIKSRRMRWEGYAESMRKENNAYGFWWAGEIPRLWWKDNIEMYLREIG